MPGYFAVAGGNAADKRTHLIPDAGVDMIQWLENFGGEPAKKGSEDNYLMGKVFVFSYGYKGPAANINDAQKNYITSWKTSK